MNVFGLILFLLSLTTVRGNTETLLLEHKSADSVTADATYIHPLEPFRHIFTFENGLVSNIKLAIPPENIGRYLARVCWPASLPVDFSLDYSNGSLSVTGKKSNVVALRSGLSYEVPFNVHLSLLKFGVIPEDVIPMVYSILGVACISGSIAYLVLKQF